MTPAELRTRAQREVEELGPEPEDPLDLAMWVEERRGAAALLAALAGWDGALLHRSAFEIADEWSDQVVVRLLLDAAAIGE